MKILEYDERHYALARLLCHFVTSGKYETTYGECSEILSKQLNRTISAYYHMGKLLLPVAKMCRDLELPLISAIVRHKTDGKVGGNFYTMARALCPEYKGMSDEAILNTEMNRIISCNEWNQLDNYLKKHYK